MNIVLLHDAVAQDAPADELDIYTQMQFIEAALHHLGHQHARLPYTLNAEAASAHLREHRPELVFNLVESVGGSGRLIHFAPALLDSLRLPYTGCPADAVYATSNKLLAKRLLAAAGIATPDLFSAADLERLDRIPDRRYIVKSVWEHASRGLDEDSVLQTDRPADLLRILSTRIGAFGGDGFAEAYIDGREFNLSILDSPQGPQVLAPAEIVFDGYHPDKPKVIGYRAKWDESSFEYHHTPRRFDFHAADQPLLDSLRAIALRCWHVFGLRGYARVDFRVNEHGKPWVLEINTNPCLSPDAGFAAALERTQIAYAHAIERILAASTVDVSTLPAPKISSPHKSTSLRAASFRDDPRPTDPQAIRDIVASTGFFHDFEIDVAVELIDERLARGLASEYFFLFADDPDTGKPLGYACFGPIACTVGSCDLYWIAVHNDHRGKGLGRVLMLEMERRIAAGFPNPAAPSDTIRARRIYIETSSKPQYEPTRTFYLRCGYREEARFADFYAPGDDKLVYVKAVG